MGIEPLSLAYVPNHFKTEEMCNPAVVLSPYTLKYILDQYRTQEICVIVVCINPALFFLIPDHFKTEEMSIKGVEVDPWQLHYVSDHFKTQEMCDNVVQEDLFSLQFVPYWFLTQEQVKVWHDYDDYFYHDKLIKWYDGYKKRKAQNAKIEEELMPTVWYPSRRWDWCVPEDEEKEREKLWK